MADQDPNTFRDVFSPLASVIAFFGGLGGLIRALVLRSTWRDMLRTILVGAGTAFGFGTLSPHILPWMIGSDVVLTGPALGAVTASAFILGIIAIALVERVIAQAAVASGADSGVKAEVASRTDSTETGTDDAQ